MVAIWINKVKYIRFEGLKLKINFVKNFGPGPTSIVVDSKDKEKTGPEKDSNQDQPQWWQAGMK